ncbi:AEC family transporter [Kineococcus glutinatus]|uniref:AEC family transporter n=1 Tax=Kineococcus glutinatus TaxID=1070872 RepID=A0ABP9I994_9ACTN
MSGVLTGGAVVATLIAVGWVLGRTGVLGEGAQPVIARLVFFVGSPALLVDVLARADVRTLLSGQLAATAASVAACLVLFAVAARWRWRLRRGEVVIGALCSSFVNAANIGLPVAVYVLGDATAVLPAMLLQMVLVGPAALALLDVGTAAGGRVRLRHLLRPLANPLLAASAVGIALSLTGARLPTAVAQPLSLLAGLAVPGALLAFGISLAGGARPAWRRAEVRLAVAAKVLLQPAVAYATARFAVGMAPSGVFAATVVAALPTAQNVFTYAVRYDRGVALARDSVLLSTLLCAPVIAAAALLLA